jgi:hypothetical protein
MPAGTGGLVHVIDEWLNTEEIKTVEHVRENANNIVEYARQQYCT